MIIYLGARTSNLDHEIGVLRSIITAIHISGNSLARNWVEPEFQRLEMRPKPRGKQDWAKICQENLASLEMADAGIFEVSDRSCFGVGYVAALMLQAGKSALFLVRPESQPDGSFAAGLEDPLITWAEYNNENVAEIVAKFMNSIEIGGRA